MIYELKLHTLVRFDYAMQTSLPVWMVRLIASNNFEFNMGDRKWYWQRTTIINDGDYVVRIDPKLLEYARLQQGEDPRVKHANDVFLSTLMGQFRGSDDEAWADGFGYGIMSAEKLDSITREDEILAGRIDAAIAAMYAAIDGAKETRQ